MKQLKKLSSLLVIVAALGLVSCGSDKKKSGGDQMDSLQGVSNGFSLDDVALNADSDSGKAGGLQTVNFGFNSATLSDSARSALDNNAEFLKRFPSLEVQIEGHADERGGVQYNIALGEKRAMTIKDYLSARGVSSSRISTISFGKERPLSFGHEESSWGQNRRGNFVVTAK